MSIDEDSDLEWPTGLEGVQNYQLVDELIERGWIEIGRPQTVLRAPSDYDPQDTRRSQ